MSGLFEFIKRFLFLVLPFGHIYAVANVESCQVEWGQTFVHGEACGRLSFFWGVKHSDVSDLSRGRCHKLNIFVATFSIV